MLQIHKSTNPIILRTISPYFWHGDGKGARTDPTGGRCFYRTIECPANAGAAGGGMKEQIKTGRRRKYKSLICKVYPTIRAPSAHHLQADLYQTTLEKLIQVSSPSSQLFKNCQLILLSSLSIFFNLSRPKKIYKTNPFNY